MTRAVRASAWCTTVFVLALSSVAHAGANAHAKADAKADAKPSAKSHTPAPTRRIVVSEFDAAADSHVRNAVLDALSEHTEVEVVGYEDVAVTAHRLGADVKSHDGRRKLAAELGVFAWVDGEVSTRAASVSLNTSDGVCLAKAELSGASAAAVEAQVGVRVWEAVGAILSEPERLRRRLLAEQTLAKHKVQAREQELQRQREVAEERSRVRQRRLQAERTLAHGKHAALLAEVQRQAVLVQERVVAEARERQRQEDLQRQAAQAEERRMLAQQEAERRAAAWQPPTQQQPSPWQPPTSASRVNPAPSYAVPAAAPPSYASTAPSYGSTPPSYASTAPSYASTVPPNRGFVPHDFGQPVGAVAAEPAPTTSATPIVVEGGEVSPATKAWLAKQGLRTN